MSLSRRSFLARTAAFAGTVTLHPFAARAQAGQAHLRILSTTDLHCHLYPYDYYADKPNDTVGMSRTASLIEEIRAEAGNSILVDNGDYIQGNPLGDYMAYEKGMDSGETHPVAAAMNTLEFDAGTVGNHEFNYGMEFLDKVTAQTARPITCANFARKLSKDPLDDALHFQPFVMLDREMVDGAGRKRPIRIGLIGFVPPQIMQWDAGHLGDRFETRDIVEAARAWVPEMRAQGAEVVIALSHSGLSLDPASPGMENASYYLADIEGIDAIVMGHAHAVWPSDDYAGEGLDPTSGRIKGVPAVMAGFWGSHMGLIDLLLEHDGKRWQVVDSSSEARPISRLTEDRKIEPLVGDYAPALAAARQGHEETLEYVRAEIGRTDSPLFSYFAQVADDPSVQIVSLAQLWYAGQLLKGSEYETLPLLSAAAPFKAGGRGGPEYYTDVPKGPVAIKNAADLYLYPNTLQIVKVTGAQLKDWLERSAGQFNRIVPGTQDAPLLNPDFRSYNFDVIDGVSYRIDLSQPSKYGVAEGELLDEAASRIIDLAYEGKPLDAEQEFLIATNNYRASGGGNFPGADGSTVILTAPDTNRDVLVRYIIEQGTISPDADRNWSFVPVEGASAVFDTGPKARVYLAAMRERGLDLEEVGHGEDGFARYRIRL
ncbi:bifunctional 2',3'-cyclic-nucleotide 2'-phosphodiesterase/3'-nucleotidase [Paracoccus sp. MBLB3053]|uniref:Bifunctional 2',3'-cyclic-nucleotide 2'-phosphodiesterase/3'-nucleotidase n=1 Tax=Paracoccus aurantius TaxID=3073814 RepID=A0ABU2HS10_9RHOB|nr:bifunctional 2',3'-cyclic-nucleotide 2'-phosphodiesterase/3'-nucleotidase [Paracoccus sp. MBLB3053]MDS9467849.1 bifunctional 2',3'-cyclic-nucleotide 2'-phosphodiesterase/3'-nucleotidase [Paracoccus sp. MBLB3053]